VKAYGVAPRGSFLGSRGGDAGLGTHIVGITSFHPTNIASRAAGHNPFAQNSCDLDVNVSNFTVNTTCPRE